MNEDDIIKALEICGGYRCVGCPMERRINCRGILAKETLKLMKSQKTELDMLRRKASGGTVDKISRFARALSDKNRKYAEEEGQPLAKAEFRGIQMGALLVVRYIVGLEKGTVTEYEESEHE